MILALQHIYFSYRPKCHWRAYCWWNSYAGIQIVFSYLVSFKVITVYDERLMNSRSNKQSLAVV